VRLGEPGTFRQWAARARAAALIGDRRAQAVDDPADGPEALRQARGEARVLAERQHRLVEPAPIHRR
jgi:hypothetical protein